MLTKEIVMSVLEELGRILPEEEFYDESESLLTDSEEDLKLYTNFPVDTLDKTAIMVARLDGGKYALSLKKGAKVCSLDQNVIFRLSDVTNEGVNEEVGEGVGGEEEVGNKVADPSAESDLAKTTLEKEMAGGFRGNLDQALSLIRGQVPKEVDKDAPTDVHAVDVSYESGPDPSVKRAVFRWGKPVPTDILFMAGSSDKKTVKRLLSHEKEGQRLTDDEVVHRLYGNSDLFTTLPFTISGDKEPKVTKLYVPDNPRYRAISLSKKKSNNPHVNIDDPIDTLAYSLAILAQRKDSPNIPIHIRKNTADIRKLLTEHSDLGSDEIDGIMAKVASPEFAQLVAQKAQQPNLSPKEIEKTPIDDKIIAAIIKKNKKPEAIKRLLESRLEHITDNETNIISDALFKLSKNPNYYSELYEKNRKTKVPTAKTIYNLEHQHFYPLDPGKQNHTFIRAHTANSNKSDVEDDTKHNRTIMALTRKSYLDGIQARGEEHLERELGRNTKLLGVMVDSAFRRAQSAPPEEKQAEIDRFEKLKTTHDSFLYLYSLLKLGLRPQPEDETQAKNKSKKKKSNEEEQTVFGLSTLQHSHIFQDPETGKLKLLFPGKGSTSEESYASYAPVEDETLNKLLLKQIERNKRFYGQNGEINPTHNLFQITPDSAVYLPFHKDTLLNINDLGRRLGLLSGPENRPSYNFSPYSFRKLRATRRVTDLAHAFGVVHARRELLKRIHNDRYYDTSKEEELPQEEFKALIDKKLRKARGKNKKLFGEILKKLKESFNVGTFGLDQRANFHLQHAFTSKAWETYANRVLLHKAYALGVEELLRSLRNK